MSRSPSPGYGDHMVRTRTLANIRTRAGSLPQVTPTALNKHQLIRVV